MRVMSIDSTGRAGTRLASRNASLDSELFSNEEGRNYET
jgi:hypothetical protein